MFEAVREYAKSVTAAVGGVVTLVQAVIANEAITFDEAQGIYTAVLLAVTAIAVGLVPNKEP